MRKIAIVSGAACLLGLWACGDDTTAGKPDGGSGKDAGAQIPRLDAATGDDLVPQCNRFDDLSCGDGQVCNELVRTLPDGTDVGYGGCVSSNRLRGAGDPCTPWSERYELEGLTDAVLLDPCGDGTVCADDPEIRGASSCQPGCATGQFGDAPRGCASKSAFCFGQGPLQEVCIESDGCDPAKQTGCGVGEACYLQLNDSADGVLSVCLPLGEPEIPDHEPCIYVNDCAAGSSCLGPADAALSAWGEEEFLCRPLCSGPNDHTAVDAGLDDAGSAAGCTCTAYSSKFLDFSEVPKPPYGQCQQ
jgi:hypothetical protein